MVDQFWLRAASIETQQFEECLLKEVQLLSYSPRQAHVSFPTFSCLCLAVNGPVKETKERECWKFLDWRLNPENDSRVHGQPSNASFRESWFNL